jgi:hypothetical protein
VTERRERTPGEERFWSLADPLLRQAGVSRSTMMGFPCLRLDGDFFASCDHRSGNLIVKLTEARVSSLVASGRAEPFAPSGRPFREWASIPLARQRSWSRLVEEALQLSAERNAGSASSSTRSSSRRR